MVYSQNGDIMSEFLDQTRSLVSSDRYGGSSPDLRRFCREQSSEEWRPQRGWRQQRPDTRRGSGPGYLRANQPCRAQSQSPYKREDGGRQIRWQSPKRNAGIGSRPGRTAGWEAGGAADRLCVPAVDQLFSLPTAAAAAAASTRHSPSSQSVRSQDSGFSDLAETGPGLTAVGQPPIELARSCARLDSCGWASSRERPDSSSSCRQVIRTSDKEPAEEGSAGGACTAPHPEEYG